MKREEFRINFNVTGPERKELVKAISEILEVKAEYLWTPTFAYQVGTYTVTKDGALVFDSFSADSEEVEMLLEELSKKGFEGEGQLEMKEEPDTPPENLEEKKEVPSVSKTGYAYITLPYECIDEASIARLEKLVAAKEGLIKKALGMDGTELLKIEKRPQGITFPWFQFDFGDPDCRAYAEFIEKLVALAKKLKRVNVKEKPVENEKYAFRCFLLRLGFIGKKYKDTRKRLLRNFIGNGAFKEGKKRGSSKEISK